MKKKLSLALGVVVAAMMSLTGCERTLDIQGTLDVTVWHYGSGSAEVNIYPYSSTYSVTSGVPALVTVALQSGKNELSFGLNAGDYLVTCTDNSIQAAQVSPGETTLITFSID